MKLTQYLLIVISLVMFITNVFAEGADWVAFPDENIKTYPIIFGNIKEPDATTIDCENNFYPSTFKPSQDNSEIELSYFCKKDRITGKDLFFYIGNLNENNKFQSIIAKDLFRFYFIKTNIRTSQDQNLTLTFPFKLS